nr:glycosyltransferase [Bacteroidota bacterium]
MEKRGGVGRQYMGIPGGDNVDIVSKRRAERNADVIESDNVIVGILHYNAPGKLRRTLKNTIEKAGYNRFRTVVLDNGGLDKAIVKEFPDVKFIFSKENLGMQKGYNRLLRERKKGQWFCMINEDNTVVRDNWLKELLTKGRKYANTGCITYNFKGERRFNELLIKRLGKDAHVCASGAGFRLLSPRMINTIGGYYAPPVRRRWVSGLEYQERMRFAGFNIYVVDYDTHGIVHYGSMRGYVGELDELRGRIQSYSMNNIHVKL